MADLCCDVAVIGAGTAGLAAERNARRAGATTLLIDGRFAGTTCATVGCMPSKLLIAAANAAHSVRRAPVFGIELADPVINGAAVLARVRHERDRFVAGVQASFAALPDQTRIRARARFTGQTSLALDDGRTVTARAVVIATGAVPKIPAPFETLGARILTNETIFDLPDLPRSVAVIGAGPLGIELAQALSRLGVETAVFDKGNRLAGLQDRTVSQALGQILQRELPIRLGVTLEVRPDGDGVALNWNGEDAGSGRFERLLVATGRPPNLQGLVLEAAGIALDEHGTPRFDASTMQCGQSPIFIAGDANAERPVLHEAMSEGGIAGVNAARFPDVRPARRTVPFSLVFTDPAVAIIGQSAGKLDAVIGRASYEDQGRAKVMARNNGLVHIYAERKTGRLIGAALAAPGAEHIGHLIAWAVERGQTANDLLDLPFYHPTLEEGLKPALREICRAVHAALPAERDEGSPPGA